MPYNWDYAPTNRAGCKGKCKEKLEKGQLRFVSSDDDAKFVQYRCLNCVTEKQIENIKSSLGGLDKMGGFSDLSKADQALVRKANSSVPAGKAEPKSKAKAKAEPKGKATAEPKAKSKAEEAKPKGKAMAKAQRVPPVEVQHAFLDHAKAHEWDTVKVMVEEMGDSLANCRPNGRWSALMQAVSEGENEEIVRFLLDHGGDVNIRAGDGKNAKDVDVAGLLGEEREEGTKRKSEGGSSGSGAPAAKKAKPSGGRPVDPAVPDRGKYTVVDDYSAMLNQTNVGANNNKFYRVQLLTTGSEFFVWTHWGRVGAHGQTAMLPCVADATRYNLFKTKFKSKTGVFWENLHSHDWTPKVGKYTYVETDEQEGADGADSAPLGKLTPQQIEKGQGVLKKIGSFLSKAKKVTGSDLDMLSSEYYTLVPHDFGMKAPPSINSTEMLETEEELLKFFMRMGFEQMDEADTGLTPLDGIMDLELPATLNAAASKVCAKSEISSSDAKAKQHEAKQSGNPVRKMSTALYSAIMLYTSNAIYKDLNAALRNEDRSGIKKYFQYLRLLLEALGTLPQEKKTLWRGVGVDLHAQYKVGSTVTWWGVSSCTADVNVAKNFMKGCGGKCTLLTVKTTTASDISSITFFGNEKENLLAPGTQLKVLSNKVVGNVTNITMEEVGRVLK